MTDKQVAFEDLIAVDKKLKSTSTAKKNLAKKSEGKKASTKSSATKKKNSKKNTKEKSNKNTSKLNKTSSRSTSRVKNSKVNVTQEDMDKLCEVYDWYLQIKDLDLVKANVNMKKSSINIDEEIIKNKKRIASVVDENIWEDFSRLCENTCHKKGDVLTQAIKEFLLKHKDLI